LGHVYSSPCFDDRTRNVFGDEVHDAIASEDSEPDDADFLLPRFYIVVHPFVRRGGSTLDFFGRWYSLH